MPAPVSASGFSFTQTSARIARADPERQEEYIARGRRTCGLWTKCFQQYGSRCRMWVPPETQDPILNHPGRASVGYFGAVRLRDGKFVYQRETGRFNRELLRLLEATAADHFPFPVSRGRPGRQRQLSSRQIAPALEREGQREIRPRLPTALQPRPEPDRARLETDPPNLPAQSLLSWKRSSIR